MNIATINIIDDERLLTSVLDFIDSIAKKLNFAKDKEMKIGVACEEIISDRIKNAYQDGGIITIEICLTNDTFEVSVLDKGLPYWKSKTCYDPQNIDENASGLEDFLILNMADGSGCEKLGRGGQRMFLRFALPVPIELKQRETKTIAVLDTNIEINEVKADDDEAIINAIACIYDEYQYSYGYERLYYPEHFKELIANKNYRSFIAVNSHKQAAGHYGLAYSDDYPEMPEWASVVVRHEFRGMGLFDKMLAHGIEAAKSAAARAIMTQPTAYHTATQKIALRQGFVATGILFNYVYSDIISEYNTDGRRLDLFIAAKFFDDDIKKAVYLPKEHICFSQEIYKKLNAPREFLSSVLPASETNMKHEVNALMKSGKLVVKRASADFGNELSQVMRAMRKNKLEMAEMLISMSDPSAVFAYEKCKALGFFFTGIIPCCGEADDYLLMQNLFEDEPNFDDIKSIGEYTDLLEYVKLKWRA